MNVNGHNLMNFTLCTVDSPLNGHSNERSSPFYSRKMCVVSHHFNTVNGIHFQTDLFDSKYQLDPLTLTTVKFDE